MLVDFDSIAWLENLSESRSPAKSDFSGCAEFADSSDMGKHRHLVGLVSLHRPRCGRLNLRLVAANMVIQCFSLNMKGLRCTLPRGWLILWALATVGCATCIDDGQLRTAATQVMRAPTPASTPTPNPELPPPVPTGADPDNESVAAAEPREAESPVSRQPQRQPQKVVPAAYQADPTRSAPPVTGTRRPRMPPPIGYFPEHHESLIKVNYEEEPGPASEATPEPVAPTAPRSNRRTTQGRVTQLKKALPDEVQELLNEVLPQEAAPESAAEPEAPLLPPVAPGTRIHVPLDGDEPSEDVQLTMKNGRVSLIARKAPVQSVLNLLAQQQGINLIAADDVTGDISVNLANTNFDDALSSIVAIAGCTWTEQKGIVLVTKVSLDARASPGVQGKVVQVFSLSFVAAADIEAALRGLISPMGQIFITESSPADKRRTQEQVVVEDIPSSLERIAEYIARVDQPPRQVVIEAHVLQVDLKDDTRHGINWQEITRIATSDVTLATQGFANAAASPGSIFQVDGKHLDLLVEALKTTTDTKTLANPRVTVANGQEARIQIGSKLGYFVTTTTQTSTLQNVNFLNTGVLLRVTPQISADNRVLMHVQPEVSSGKISLAGLPETQTTEASTTVLMENGGGIVIGGLIKEFDNETQDKVPILGDVWLVGRLFQRRNYTRQRSEIVIVMVPRIAPYTADYQEAEQWDVARSREPLFEDGLHQAPRPWEARLPDAMRNPRRLRPRRLPGIFSNPWRSDPKPLQHYFPTHNEEYAPDAPNGVILPLEAGQGTNDTDVYYEAGPPPSPAYDTPQPAPQPPAPQASASPRGPVTQQGWRQVKPN